MKNKLETFVKSLQPDEQLSKEMSRFLISLMLDGEELSKSLNEIDKTSQSYELFSPVLNSHLVKIFVNRVELLTTLKLDVASILFISAYLRNPAHSVMYAYFLSMKFAPNTNIDLKTLCANAFPWGMLSETQLRNLWDIQKIGDIEYVKNMRCIGAPDNLLDYYETWNKI